MLMKTLTQKSSADNKRKSRDYDADEDDRTSTKGPSIMDLLNSDTTMMTSCEHLPSSTHWSLSEDTIMMFRAEDGPTPEFIFGSGGGNLSSKGSNKEGTKVTPLAKGAKTGSSTLMIEDEEEILVYLAISHSFKTSWNDRLAGIHRLVIKPSRLAIITTFLVRNRCYWACLETQDAAITLLYGMGWGPEVEPEDYDSSAVFPFPTIYQEPTQLIQLLLAQGYVTNKCVALMDVEEMERMNAEEMERMSMETMTTTTVSSHTTVGTNMSSSGLHESGRSMRLEPAEAWLVNSLKAKTETMRHLGYCSSDDAMTSEPKGESNPKAEMEQKASPKRNRDSKSIAKIEGVTPHYSKRRFWRSITTRKTASGELIKCAGPCCKKQPVYVRGGTWFCCELCEDKWKTTAEAEMSLHQVHNFKDWGKEWQHKRFEPPPPPPSSSMCIVPLHNMKTVGIDTDSGKSISTDVRDFVHIDTSDEAKDSCVIRGVGGNGSIVGGRGPMIVPVRTSVGNIVLMIDPEGVYVEKESTQPSFRVFAQQRFRMWGLRLVQMYKGTDVDVLECLKTGTIIPLATEKGILVVHSEPYLDRCVSWPIMREILDLKRSPLVEKECK
jgi:hypothetical protein